jgi:hypothetical protein
MTKRTRRKIDAALKARIALEALRSRPVWPIWPSAMTQRLPAALGNEYHVIFALPLRVA